MITTCTQCGCLMEEGHVCDPGEVEIKASFDRMLEYHAAKDEVVAAAQALDQAFVRWDKLGLAGVRMETALLRFHKIQVQVASEKKT